MKKLLFGHLIGASLGLFALILLVLPVFAAEDLKSGGTSGDRKVLSGNVTGLSGKLIIELNGDEVVAITGDGPFKFKNNFSDKPEYTVMIKKPAANHRCEVKNGQGLVTANGKSAIDIICQQTGKWDFPASLVDNLSLDGQDAVNPAVALDGQGHGVVVWSQFDGKFWRILKSEYRDQKWHKPVSFRDAISPGDSDAKNPLVAMASNGDMVVVWEQKTGKKRNILMAENRDGKWKLPKSVAEHISSKDKSAREPDVAIDDVGNTVIVWSQESATKDYAVYKSEYRNGSWHHPAPIDDVVSPKGGYALKPRVVMNNKGMTIITWYQDSLGTNNIYKSVYQGGAWKHPADSGDYISQSGRGTGAINPILALGDNGRAVIAWQQAYNDQLRIYKSEFDGSVWNKPLLTEAITPLTREHDNAVLNSLSMDSKGNALIMWSLQSVFNQALYLSRLQDGKWQHPGENDYLTGSKKDSHFDIFAKVAMSDSGKSVIAWQQKGEDRISRVFMTEFDNGIWHLPGRQLSMLDNSAKNVGIASAKNGDFIVVWQQSDGKVDQIYKSEFHVLKK
jgi:hypothetical protein